MRPGFDSVAETDRAVHGTQPEQGHSLSLEFLFFLCESDLNLGYIPTGIEMDIRFQAPRRGVDSRLLTERFHFSILALGHFDFDTIWPEQFGLTSVVSQ